MTGPRDGDASGPNALERRLIRRIARHGPISLSDFMHEAMSDPHDGYYTTRDPLGTGGDFITAPEISQMFGELIGLWCADTWQRCGSPARMLLVELGPGRGTLMADALRACRVVHGFLEAAEVHLVETSPTLRSLQARQLSQAHVTWHDRFADLPGDIPLLAIANEFFDALPIRQYEKTPEGWSERLVGLAPDGGGLAFGLSAPTPQASPLIPEPLRNAAAGSVAEVCPAALGLVAEIGRRLRQDGGAALLVDYGYFQASGKPTLQAVQGHRPQPPLAAPGTADLTAHVDFGTLIRAARETGCQTLGPVAQGRFLAALGIAARAERLLAAATPTQVEEIRSALARLTAADQMGEAFQALAVTGPALGPLAGFSD